MLYNTSQIEIEAVHLICDLDLSCLHIARRLSNKGTLARNEAICSRSKLQQGHYVKPDMNAIGNIYLYRNACAYLRQGGKLPLRVHLCICMFLHRGRFLSLNSIPEEQCLAYWSPSNAMLIWGSGDLSQEKFLEQNCLQRKIPLQK